MALIKCSECGGDVSDKAASCPHCGNPISKEEEYICCPKCKSKDLQAFQSGFSGGKAVAGALLTGGIGILAGTIGSKDIMLGCKSCGNRFKAGDGLIIKTGGSNDEMNSKIIELSKKSILEAIKYYKNETGCSLSESKKYVESLVGNNNTSGNSGCASVLIIAIVITGLVFIL